MKKILYIGTFIDEENQKLLTKDLSVSLSFASCNHQIAIIKGIEHCINEKLDCIVRPTFPYYPKYKHLNIKSKKINNNVFQVGYLNIRGIRKFISYVRLKWNVNKHIKTGKYNKVIAYEKSFDINKVMKYIKKKYRNQIETAIIIPDVPQVLNTYGKNNIFKFIAKHLDNENDFSHYDKFVLLSEQMRELIDIKSKPYCVVDGLYDNKFLNFDSCVKVKQENRTILYTGTLKKEFGIVEMLKAFHLLSDKNLNLLIAGSGDGIDEVIDMAKKDNRIKYLGVLNKEDIRQAQFNATLLINPRSKKSIDSKYSFPSKTIEYMLSGRPLLMSRLHGVGKEYYNYFYEMDDTDIESISQSINNVIHLSDDELNNMGMLSRKFVLENNSNIKKAQLIVDLLYN